MKKRRVSRLFLTIAMLICLTLGAGSVQAATTQTTSTVTRATVKNGWIKERAGWCYYVKGKKIVSQLRKINGATYYLGANGARKTGWYTVRSGNSYKSMQFAYDGKYTGKSKAVNANMMKKADAVIASQKISTCLTTDAQKKDALYKLYTYAKKNYTYRRVMEQFGRGKSLSYAQKTMINKTGNCYGFASSFAVLAKRATGLPVRVCWGTSTAFDKNRSQAHGWTEIKIGNTWYIFDTNAAKYSTRKDVKWYMQNSSSATMKKVYKKTAYEEILL